MLRELKQIISVFVICILAVSVFPMQAMAAWNAPETGNDWELLDRTGIKARFAVGSDIHIGYGYNGPEKLENALAVFKTIDPGMDGIIFAGDLTGDGIADQYDTMMGIANRSSMGDKIIWAMGNHEYYGWNNSTPAAIGMFTDKTGQEPDKVTTPGGITVITLGSNSYDGGDYSEQYDFLEGALASAKQANMSKGDPYAPIFVIAHHGIKDTAYTTNEWYGNYGEGTDKDMVALMAQYPQVIHISGHSHATVDEPTSIDQSKGFTTIQDATLGAYFENESGKIVSDGKYSTYPENSAEASQALLIDIDNDNRVIVKRMNLTSGKYIYEGEPWIIDIPQLVGSRAFTYTDDRANNSKAPAFADGAQVTVKKTDANSVAFSFSQALAADGLNDNMVHSYKMKVTNLQTGEAIRDNKYNRDYYLRFSDYYRATQASELSAKISGLSPDTEYKIEVWALTPYSVESSNSITTNFTTVSESNTPQITSELITQKPVINGNLNEPFWSVDKKAAKDLNGNATHKGNFDVKWDNDNLYLAVQVQNDSELAPGTAWSKGDIVWVYLDSTLHAGTPYIDGDWQIGIGYNPVDNLKPYIIMGGGVTAGSEAKTALSESISAATVPTADGWNAEIAIPWDKLEMDIRNKRELGFDLSIDNYQQNKDLQALIWCGGTWNDTSGFGKLILSSGSILDVDFSDGTAKDNSPAAHTAIVKGNPVISPNTDLGKYIASFDGKDDAYAYNLTAGDYENIKNGFTMELMMKLKEFLNGDPFMNCDGAGLGFELNSDGKTLEFWAHINGSYVVPAVDISAIKSEWLHATATYDGAALKIYINGELKASEAATGVLDIPQDSAKWLMIGSDTGSNGSVQLPIACDVSNARLYGKALSKDEVAQLFVRDNPVRFTLSNNSDLTGTVGQAVTIPSATAKDANGTWEVTTSVTGPDGESIAINNNAFLPAKAGTYIITYTAREQRLIKAVTVSNASGGNNGNNGNGGNNGSNGNSGGSGNNGSSGSGSNGSSSAPKTYQAEVTAAGAGITTMPVSVDKVSGSASVELDTRKENVFGGRGTSVIKVPSIPGVSNYSIKMPVDSLAGEHKGWLTFSTALGNMTIPDNMLSWVSGISGKQATITIGEGSKSKLDDAIKALTGSRPMIQLTVNVDGKKKDWNNPAAPVAVSIPYTFTAAELKNPESIIVWHIDENGKAAVIPNGHYDSATGSVKFITTNLNNFAVGIIKADFKDVSADDWYSRAVGFIAARGITTGTGGGKFNPDAKLTRGEFIVMLMKAYGITPDAGSNDNFSDAGNTYYTKYLAKAKEAGISSGIGNNMFAPDKQITRQEMFSLLYNTLKGMGQLPEGAAGKTLSDFSDSDKIASWATEALRLFTRTGDIGGSNGKLYPTAVTTRAEMAQVLYSLLSK